MTSPAFSEAELDAAAEAMASAAMHDCPDRIYDFLTQSQLEGLRDDVRAVAKTTLLFSLMNHLEPATE